MTALCDIDFVNSRYRNILTYLLTYCATDQELYRRRSDDSCSLSRWQHFSVWNDAM